MGARRRLYLVESGEGRKFHHDSRPVVRTTLRRCLGLSRVRCIGVRAWDHAATNLFAPLRKKQHDVLEVEGLLNEAHPYG